MSGADAESARREFQQAQQLFEKNPQAGAAALAAYIDAWPRSAQADDAAMVLARDAIMRRDLAEARPRLKWVIRKRPDGGLATSASLLLAQIEIEAGEFGKGYRRAAELDFSRLSREEQRAAFKLLTDFDVWRENSRAELYWRAKWLARSDSSEEAAEQEVRIRELLGGPLAEADFQVLAEELSDFTLADNLAIFAIERALARRDFTAGQRSIDWLATRSLSPEFEERMALLQEELFALKTIAEGRSLPPSLSQLGVSELPDLRGATGTLGVVLPLSGPWQRFGEESLEGILLAARIFEAAEEETAAEPASDSQGVGSGIEADASEGAGGEAAAPAIKLIVRDSAGDPVKAAEAVRELAAMPEVLAVIGPLHYAAATGSAETADGEAIPLLTLTSRVEVPVDHPYVFRFGMTQAVRVEALAELVDGPQALRRVAILYPKDRYGHRLKNGFWDAVEAHGGEVVGVASYEPKATDFANPIRSLIGYTLLTPEEKVLLDARRKLRLRAKRLPLEEAIEVREALDLLTTLEGDPLPPMVDFDALFIADSHDKVVLIAPQLAFHDVEGVRLLGAGGWNHPDLIRLGRNHVRGAIFAESFDATYPHPIIQSYVERSTLTFGKPPTQFSAQAFDAAYLALGQLAAGATSREEVARGLLRVWNYPGVSGVTNLQADGNARKRPFVLEVRWGKIHPLQ